MTSLLIYDAHCGWSPSLNASKGTGGTEVHLVQVAEWLAGQGAYVEAWCHDGKGMGVGVHYVESRDTTLRPSRCFDVAITVRRSRIPEITTGRIFTLVTDDPRPCPDDFAHLKGRSTLICVSEWQAGLYRKLGHECVVIPPPIPDYYYELAKYKRPTDTMVCVSAWNKGTQALLDVWNEKRPRLYVGSPYSHPDDAMDRCQKAGAIWLGTLTPGAIVSQLATASHHVRVVTAAETFGMTDAIAAAVGCRSIALAEGDPGALPDTVPGACWFTRQGWEEALAIGVPARKPPDYRMSKVMPMWAKLLGTK